MKILLVLLPLSELFQDRNHWLLVVFVTYLIIIFVFANVYHFLYRSNPRSFTFNGEMLRSQSLEFRLTTEASIETRTRQVEYFRFLLNELQQDKSLLDSGRILTSRVDYIVTSKYSYRFFQRTYSAGHALASVTIYYVRVFDLADTELTTQTIRYSPEDREQVFAVVTELISRLENEIQEHQQKLGSLTTDSPLIWTFWDFLYFSTITQTTVGYGDILPNKTIVRMVVVAQIVLGLLMLGILINIVFH